MTGSQMRFNDPSECIRIATGARLHFGLIDTAAPFGGVGVMIDQPATEIEVRPADRFQVDAPEAESANRVTEIANRLTRFLSMPQPPACSVRVLTRPTAHAGLGTGTQLAMAVADALMQFTGAKVTNIDLALAIADRGKRSAVGVHGYFSGGLIFESSGQNTSELNEIQYRVELPSEWTAVIAKRTTPCDAVYGTDEQQQFSALGGANPDARDELSRIVTSEMIPAAQSGDFGGFAQSVHRYNYQSGMLFSPVQGGPYNGTEVSQLVETLISRGAQGVGQSSWGPSVFSWFKDNESAQQFVSQWDADEETEFTLCRPLNTGHR